MNILYLSRTMGQGGAEKIVYQLATETARKGANVFVASCGGVYVDMLEAYGVRHIQIDDLECKKSQVIIRTIKTLAEVIRREKIGIVHTHHRMAQFYAVLLKGLFPRLSIVYTAHNVFFDKVVFTKIVLCSGTIVAVGNGVRENLIQKFSVSPDRIHVIYNGVQVENIDSAYKNETLKGLKDQGNVLIGAIGRLTRQKGMDIFISVIRQLVEKGFCVKGIIIGDGEDREFLEKNIHDRNMDNDVMLLGYQKHIPTLISQLDLVIMPSRWEGFPLLPLEVFSANRTIVASDIIGICEIIKHMDNGILVPVDNENAFAEAAEMLLLDEKLKRDLEKKGKQTFAKYNNYTDFVEQYIQVYEEIVRK